jgi:hypothetical protein
MNEGKKGRNEIKLDVSKLRGFSTSRKVNTGIKAIKFKMMIIYPGAVDLVT